MPGHRGLKGYRLLEHTTDAYWEAYGRSLEEAFESAAMALVDTMLDIGRVAPSVRTKLEARGFDLENLLYNWLEAVLLKLVVDGIALCRFEPTIEREGELRITATAYGEPLNLAKHGYKVEVKAVTYHRMEVFQEGGLWYARFVLDL
jgi:SHS2 domain-containing protein